MNDVYITQREFKIEFGLTEDYDIPKETIKEYVALVKKLYKLHKDVENLCKKKFEIDYNGERVKIVVGGRLQGFSTLMGKYSSNKISFELSYVDSSRGYTPFWTYTRFGDNAKSVARVAYNHFMNNQLATLINKHGKVGLHLSYRNGINDYTHPLMKTIRIEGVSFIQTLRIRKPDGTLANLCEYTIKENIQDSRMAWRVIESMK